MQKLIMHVASLYFWHPDDYEERLDDRIHAALDAGLDGVEISNGVEGILTWRPHPDTLQRLRNCTVTLHAELNPAIGFTLSRWLKAVSSLPFDISNATFHPDELEPEDFVNLASLPFPASIENMDDTRPDWRTVDEVRKVMVPGVNFTLDTAHAESNDLLITHFTPLFVPLETHLSIPNDNFYDVWQTPHALTQYRPDDFPDVPSACPIVTLEGVVPSDMDVLKDEVQFVRGKLK